MGSPVPGEREQPAQGGGRHLPVAHREREWPEACTSLGDALLCLDASLPRGGGALAHTGRFLFYPAVNGYIK